MAARVAAWDVSPEVARTIVSAAKRSSVYRIVRPDLAGACPLDVWVDGEHGFVQFGLDEARSPDRRPGWLLFGVRLGNGRLIAAKRLAPGPGEMEVTVVDVLA